MKFREIVDAFNNDNADAASLLKIVLTLSILISVLFYFYPGWVTGFLCAALWVGFGLLFNLCVKMARMDREENMLGIAGTYINEADTLEEKERRKSMLATMGVAAVAHEAIAAHSAARYNVDGAPMIPGMDVDIYGRAMGDTNDFLTNFESPSMDVGNGMPLSPDMSYQPPSGMND